MKTKLTVLDSVKRASARSATVVHTEMKRGVNSLATISSVAPFIGMFGTVLGIVDSFPGYNGEKSKLFGIIAGRLADSLVPGTLGLLVALIALCCHKYLLAQLDDLDVEMENASVQLISDLRSTNI